MTILWKGVEALSDFRLAALKKAVAGALGRKVRIDSEFVYLLDLAEPFTDEESASLVDTALLVVLVRLSVGSAFQQTVRSPPKPVKPQTDSEVSWNTRGVEEPSSLGL